VGLTTLPCKKKIVEKPPRNSARFCGGGQGLSWVVEPRKERRRLYLLQYHMHMFLDIFTLKIKMHVITEDYVCGTSRLYRNKYIKLKINTW
jgi:hypothetical protein